MDSLLRVHDLRVSFDTYAGEVRAVRGVSFELKAGETLALVGESGCGKTVTAKAILRLLGRTSGEIKHGSEVCFENEDVLSMGPKRLRQFRGRDISIIFQDPMTSLNPTMTVGRQIMESVLAHERVSKARAGERAERLLDRVGIPDPAERMHYYPHQMSGGMRQRVMIAIALACNPRILIADEPTTALDVTIQAQLLDLLRELKAQSGMAMILVTHNLGIVAEFADRVYVMYAGVIVEHGTTREIFHHPKHPYTWALLNSVPGRALERKSELYSIKGTPPDLLLPLDECPFAPRCDYCMPVCRRQAPEETAISKTHGISCWLMHEMAPKIGVPFVLRGRADD